MPSKTPKQAKLMRAVAHGWQKPGGGGPSRAVAQEFVNADRKYSGGFAENRYWTGGLAAMDEVNSGYKGSLRNPFRTFEEGGDVDYRVPGEPGVYEAPDVEGMGPALEQMFSDMEATRKGREKEVIDYTWDKTQSREAETDLDERLEAMTGPEQVEYVKPRLLAAMAEMKTIGETPKFKQYSMKDYWLSTDQVSLWRGKWSNALQQQAREAKGPMPTEEELNRIGVDDAGNPIMMEEEGMQRGGRAQRRRGRVIPLGDGSTRDITRNTLEAQGYTYDPATDSMQQPAPTTAPATTAAAPTYDPYYGAGSTQGPQRDTNRGGRRGGRGGRGGGGRGGGTGPVDDPTCPSGRRGQRGNCLPVVPGGGGVGGGSDEPPPRIIETDPASYVGAAADSSNEESEYREQLRAHQAKIAAILGSARGGHVNYYEEGGAVRSDHAEDLVKGPNPHNPATEPASYKYWESRFHKAPAPPEEPKAAAAPEEVPWYKRLVGYGTPSRTEKELAEMEQAYGGRVRYQAGGLAVAAPGRILPPAGGIPPWIEPVGSGPGFMNEPEQGYQFGGIADRFSPPAAAPAAAQPYRGVPPQRGMISRGAQPGGLAAMRQQAQQQRAGVAGRLPPGIDPRAVAADPQGWARQQAEMQRRQGNAGSGPGGMQGAIMAPTTPEEAEWQRRNYGPNEMDRRIMSMREAMGGERNPMPGGGGFGNYDPRIRTGPSPNIGRPGYDPIGDMGPITGPGMRPGKPRPGPGSFAPGEMTPGGGNIPPWKQLPGQRRQVPPSIPPGGGGGVIGGPRVPPNQRGYLQKQQMMNRPPANVGGGANRVGMQDQQGAQARALQRGTGRPPMSRRGSFGRAR